MIEGLEWVAANFELPAVAQLSLGASTANEALDAALLVTVPIRLSLSVSMHYGFCYTPRYLEERCHSPSALVSDFSSHGAVEELGVRAVTQGLVQMGVVAVVAAGNLGSGAGP